jgi:hypothetical protein
MNAYLATLILRKLNGQWEVSSLNETSVFSAEQLSNDCIRHEDTYWWRKGENENVWEQEQQGTYYSNLILLSDEFMEAFRLAHAQGIHISRSRRTFRLFGMRI